MRLPSPRLTISLSAIFVATTCCGTAPQPPPHDAITARHRFVERLNDETIVIVQQDRTTYRPVCAGVWVSPTDILTADHCVDLGLDVLFRTNHEGVAITPHIADVIQIDEGLDLALLRTFGVDDHAVAQILVGSVYFGQPLHIVGHPGGMQYTYFTGVVSAFRTIESERYLQVSAPIWMGNSGGPAFDDAGAVVGIASMKASGPPNMGFFVPNEVLLKFLERAGSR